jgi:ArsR family transcriptional regulator
MREFISITKALSDESRVRALLALRDRELCVCQIVELLGLSPSTVSKHMSILKHARLVEARKERRWMYYRLAEDDAPAAVHAAIAWVLDVLSTTRRIKQDVKTLKEVLKIDPEELCRVQSRR